jgi:hypothetical protein
LKLVPASVMTECRARAAAGRGVDTRAGRIAAVFIVIVWIGVLVLASMWAYSAFAHQPGGAANATLP